MEKTFNTWLLAKKPRVNTENFAQNYKQFCHSQEIARTGIFKEISSISISEEFQYKQMQWDLFGCFQSTPSKQQGKEAVTAMKHGPVFPPPTAQIQ